MGQNPHCPAGHPALDATQNRVGFLGCQHTQKITCVHHSSAEMCYWVKTQFFGCYLGFTQITENKEQTVANLNKSVRFSSSSALIPS